MDPRTYRKAGVDINMGVGFLIVVARGDAARTQSVLQAAGERVFEVGEIRMGARGVQYV